MRGGTGSVLLAPPWSRDQVKWLGRGYFVLRVATDETSRWLLGAAFRESDVLPHERIFRRSALDKSELMRKLKMNPWPVHLAAEIDPETWRANMAAATTRIAPAVDTGYMTLWLLPQIETSLLPRGPFVVLDGHHSRRAQINLGFRKLLGWVEPLEAPQLRVRAIERAGWLAHWIDELLASGDLRVRAEAPEPATWTMGESQAFEIVQPSSRRWFEVAKPEAGETVVDALVRLAKGRVFLKSTADFEESLRWVERFEVDTALRLPTPSKSYVSARARGRRLLPQKATYFHPKIPFGFLVEDLS